MAARTAGNYKASRCCADFEERRSSTCKTSIDSHIGRTEVYTCAPCRSYFPSLLFLLSNVHAQVLCSQCMWRSVPGTPVKPYLALQLFLYSILSSSRSMLHAQAGVETFSINELMQPISSAPVILALYCAIPPCQPGTHRVNLTPV